MLCQSFASLKHASQVNKGQTNEIVNYANILFFNLEVAQTKAAIH